MMKLTRSEPQPGVLPDSCANSMRRASSLSVLSNQNIDQRAASGMAALRSRTASSDQLRPVPS